MKIEIKIWDRSDFYGWLRDRTTYLYISVSFGDWGLFHLDMNQDGDRRDEGLGPFCWLMLLNRSIVTYGKKWEWGWWT